MNHTHTQAYFDKANYCVYAFEIYTFGESYCSTTAKRFTTHEFFSIVKRLFTNKVYVFTLISSIFSLLSIIGFAQFLPKYFEFVFRRRASTSGLLGPVANSGATIIGLIVAGLVIGKWRPRAR